MRKLIPALVRLLAVNPATKAAPANPHVSASYSTKEAKFDTKPYKLHKLESGPAASVTLTSDDALNLYKQLFLVRRMETAAGNLYKAKAIRGFCHLYTGQEAVGVGISSALRPMDTVITSYRCHGWTVLMGGSVESMLAELTGRSAGCSRGKGGSMHMYTPTFYGGNGIVGAQVPLGAGLALAHKYRGDGGVNFALYGDGAANQGQIFEALNICKLWALPCVAVCENNGYGMGTSTDRHSASTEYYTRGDYVPGLWVDGMDVLTAREATRFAIEHCTSGKGPLMVEMGTYRYYGHSMSDPGTSYRTREEVQEVRKTRDPINSFKENILKQGLVTQEQLTQLEDEAKQTIEAATKVATSSPEVSAEELTGDIYADNLEETIRGVLPEPPMRHVRVGAAKNIG